MVFLTDLSANNVATIKNAKIQRESAGNLLKSALVFQTTDKSSCNLTMKPFSSITIDTTPKPSTFDVYKLARLKTLSDICIYRLNALKLEKNTPTKDTTQKPIPPKLALNHPNSRQPPPARRYTPSPYPYQHNPHPASCYNGYYNAPYADYYKGYHNGYVRQHYLPRQSDGQTNRVVTGYYPYIYPSRPGTG
jgi:hypothetical protein